MTKPLGDRTTFTPFFRRFTDEKALDLGTLRSLHFTVEAAHRRSRYGNEDEIIHIASEIVENINDRVHDQLLTVVCAIVWEILSLETAIFQFPVIDFDIAHLSLKEQVDLRRYLRSKQHFLANEPRVRILLIECMKNVFEAIASYLPLTVNPSPFSVPLVNTIPNPADFIERLYGTFSQAKYNDQGLFIEIADRLYRNVCEVSGAKPGDKKPLKLPGKSDAPPGKLVDDYLQGTPFHKLMLMPLPLQLTNEQRFSHMHVIGGSGAGKTQLLQNLILHDVLAAQEPALVIVDGQGDLINKLSHFKYFSEVDRLILITPKDIERPPALNIFDVNRERLGKYTAYAKEQVVAGVIQTFDYLFTGLLGADLTAKQGVFFRYVARLMLALPETMGRNATILDMIAIMEDLQPYMPAVRSLPDLQRSFFERDFVPPKGKKGTFDQTKEQIRYRLQAILENPTLARLFTSPSTKIDLFTELNRGSIILVDTAKDFLKGASSNFGCIFISLVLQAILERAAIPEDQRKPAFLIVDEAASYFDSNIDDLLTEARKYKLGICLAHQFLDQASSSLRSSLASNTAIKMASGISTGDARQLAPDMRTTPDFILSQKQLHFASYIRGVTPQAVSIPVEYGLLEKQPQLTEDEYATLLERNREKVSLPPDLPKPAPRPPEPPEAEPVEPFHPRPGPDSGGPIIDVEFSVHKGTPSLSPRLPKPSSTPDDLKPSKEW